MTMTNSKVVRGYKGFETDMTCWGFQYKVGQTYEMDGEIALGERGFHFCGAMGPVLEDYPRGGSRYAEVEALGKVINGYGLYVTDKIRIVRELTSDEVTNLINTGIRNSGSYNSGSCNAGDCNTGDYNTGNCNAGSFNTGERNTGSMNTGDYNYGDYNTGDCNTGDYNTGDRNTGSFNTGAYNSGRHNTGNCNTGAYNSGNHNAGDFNACDYSVGAFNTIAQPIMLFNRPCNWTMDQFHGRKAWSVLLQMPATVRWKREEEMDAIEKEWKPSYVTTGGYLMEDESGRQAWWDRLDAESKAAVMQLPNFEREIFHTCTGIWA